MAHISKFGEVVSSALTPGGYKDARKELHGSFAIQIGEIVAVYTNDDSKNDPLGGEGVYTLYDVRLKKPDGGTETIYRCRSLQPLFGGGINNYMEVVPTIPEQPSSSMGLGVGSQNKPREERRGHQVVVGFLGGYKAAGVILGGLPHPSPLAKENRPTQDEGVITRIEIQGTMVEINNDGEFTLKFQGPKDDKGQPVDATANPTTVNIDKDGVLSLITKEDEQMVVMDGKSGTIEITNKNTVITMDGSTVSIVGDAVEIGSSGLEPHVCGNTWKSIMEDLIDEISQIIVPTGTGPSGTPQNAAKFSTIKQKLKSALSSKHTVEK